MEAPSYRLRGGTGKLIERLSQELEEDRVVLNAGVTHLEEIGDNIVLLRQRDGTAAWRLYGRGGNGGTAGIYAALGAPIPICWSQILHMKNLQIRK